MRCILSYIIRYIFTEFNVRVAPVALEIKPVVEVHESRFFVGWETMPAGIGLCRVRRGAGWNSDSGVLRAMGQVKVPKLPTIRRLPTYLYKLSEMRKAGVSIVATPELARYMNLGEIVIRKDLAITGVTGQPGVGYKVKELIDAIKSYLNWDNDSEAVLVGAGSLGSALLGYEGFEEYGLRIIAAFDSDPEKIGLEVRGRSVFDVDRLEELVARLQVRMGIICVPAAFAQEVADRMVRGGIKAIWNFANVSLKVPDDVIVQREVIAGGLAVLSVKMNRKIAEEEGQD